MFETIYITKVKQKMFKKEVENLILMRVLENPNDSEWGVPYFTNTKPKKSITFSK